jgi:hypothetical protein
VGETTPCLEQLAPVLLFAPLRHIGNQAEETLAESIPSRSCCLALNRGVNATALGGCPDLLFILAFLKPREFGLFCCCCSGA